MVHDWSGAVLEAPAFPLRKKRAIEKSAVESAPFGELRAWAVKSPLQLV
jgi:hypothetical protein